jgi:hypothetical protein
MSLGTGQVFGDDVLNDYWRVFLVVPAALSLVR